MQAGNDVLHCSTGKQMKRLCRTSCSSSKRIGPPSIHGSLYGVMAGLVKNVSRRAYRDVAREDYDEAPENKEGEQLSPYIEDVANLE